MSTHTPGPWHFVGELRHNARVIHDAPDRRQGRSTIADMIDNEANGRLIAAAPELLDALTEAHDFLNTLLSGDANEAADWLVNHGERVNDTLFAAIAKATGN